jgi:hypothetical protein
VASGSDPIPIPEPTILDMGTNSAIKGKYTVILDPSPVEAEIPALIDEIYSLLAIE